MEEEVIPYKNFNWEYQLANFVSQRDGEKITHLSKYAVCLYNLLHLQILMIFLKKPNFVPVAFIARYNCYNLLIYITFYFQPGKSSLIYCAQCNQGIHPRCIDLTVEMMPFIQAYPWQCTDCKTCWQCRRPSDDDKMLFCDRCDRGYHIYCVGLRKVPNGRWHCQQCTMTTSTNTAITHSVSVATQHDVNVR